MATKNILFQFARSIAQWSQRFKKDDKGATAIEFAFVSVPFLGLLLGIFESAALYLNMEILENVTANAARKILVQSIVADSGASTASSPGPQYQALKNYICPNSTPRPVTALPENFDCSQVRVDVRSASAFASGTGNPVNLANDLFSSTASPQFSPGAPGTIAIVRVAYPFPLYVSFLSAVGPQAQDVAGNTTGSVKVSSGNWRRILMGTAVFRIEP